MKLASIIHNGLQPPLKLDAGLLRIHPISPSIQFPKWVQSQFTHSRNPLLYSAGCRYRWTRHLSTVSSKGIEQEEGSFTSEEETSSSQSRDDINKTESNHMIDSVGNSEARTKGPENSKSSIRTVALCVFAAVAFGVGLGLKDGVGRASEFFAGYLLEQSLSVDNLFVFVLIFKYFKVPIMYQDRVLSYGIVGAIVFRLSLILLGTATLQRFAAVNLLLAGILLYSSFKLFTAEEENSDLADNFIVKTCQKFIPVTSTYDENRFFTVVDGVWKASNILGRPLLCFSR